MSDHTAENDAGCAEYLAEIARQGREITRLSTAVRHDNMRAFLDGWFAHARNPDLLVEDAWHARQTSPIPPTTTEGADDE